MTEFTVREVEWADAQQAIREIREAVFVHEQGVPLELEWDGLDAQCVQLLAVDAAGTPIGTARMLPGGHIGRMSVLKPWRRRGVGSAMLGKLLAVARARHIERVVLNAQTRVVDFYAAHGFAVEGDEFLEAGIPHLCMSRQLADSTLTSREL